MKKRWAAFLKFLRRRGCVRSAFAAPMLICLSLVLSVPAEAQLVNDGATLTLSHLTNTLSGGLIVGTNGSFTLLVLTNGTLLTNAGSGYIGVNASAKSNTVRVTSSNTRWFMGADLNVGSNGPVSQLIVSNGGFVVDNFGALGIAPGSTNNNAIVTGAGSVWSNRNDLFVGYVGNRNSLTVSNGAMATGERGVLGIDGLSSNNLVMVTGAGAIWSNRASLYVGYSGDSNRLTVGNGGSVYASNNVVAGLNVGASSNLILLSTAALMTNRLNGVIGGDTNANANAITLTDSNTFWSIGQQLFVGSNGALNRLTVSNGAQVASAGGVIGNDAVADGNTAIITGPGSFWKMSADLEVGYSGAGNTLIVSNGAAVINDDGGIGAFLPSSGNTVVVTGTNSVWTNRFGLVVGTAGPGTQLTAAEGAIIDNIGGTIGNSLSSSNNYVLIANDGTFWVNHGTLNVGLNSASNRLVAYKGGTILASNILVGVNANATNNTLTEYAATVRATNVNGTGVFDVRRGTNIFASGLVEADRLLLTNRAGAFVFNSGTLITRGATISNSAPFVIGADPGGFATWAIMASTNKHTCFGEIVVGSNAAPALLVITNGAFLSGLGSAIIGATAGAATNSVIISGPGSGWSMDTDLHLGQVGSSNRIIIAQGGLLGNEVGVIGLGLSSSNNQVTVTDDNSMWTNLIISIGSGGPGNQLNLSNGGSAIANIVTIGGGTASSNNVVTIDGGNLVCTNFAGTALLDVRRGTNVLNAGTVDANVLLATNTLGAFVFNGGALSVRNTTNNNARIFNVGNGLNTARMNLSGGFHRFVNSLVVRSNATLAGNGTVLGAVTIANGATLAPNTLQILSFDTTPLLQGKIVMEVINNGLMQPNDQVQCSGGITYGGSLTVTNIGATPLVAGNQFFLFSGSSYSGAFNSITLPVLSTGLTWSNRLLIDGSLLVVGAAGAHFTSTTINGTNLVVSGSGGPTNATYWVLTATNVALPASNWTRLLTNQFDALGNFVFTNSISPAIPRKFYRLQVP